MKPRVNLNLDPAAHELLVDISSRAGKGRAGNKRKTTSGSRYVEALLLDADLEWRQALAHLEEAGWTRQTLLLACTILAPAMARVPESFDDLAERLEAAERTNREATRAGIDFETWMALADTIRHEGNAGALFTLAREMQRGNPRVPRHLGGEDDDGGGEGE